MPQMGESIAEGTVSRWMKAVGDTVQRDEPILEISTDKVDAEIPSPSSGVLIAIEVQEGETVEVGTIVAIIDTEAGSVAAAPTTSAPAATAPTAAVPAAAAPAAGSSPTAEAPEAPAAESAAEAVPEPVSPVAPAPSEPADPASAEERLRARSTPVVRRIAGEHGIDLGDIEGSGFGGRVTKQDVMAHIEGESVPPVAAAVPSAVAATHKPPAKASPAPQGPPVGDGMTEFLTTVRHPEFPVRPDDTVEPMDRIRRLTAEHMILAKRIAAHVHSFIEVDFSRIDRVRRESKPRWAEQGARVSYTAFVAWATSRVLREFPSVNSVISGNNIIQRGRVNLGIAVDLDPGLIVPVIRDTDHLSLVGIGTKIIDLAERARGRKLAPDEIHGATFSVTNPGVLGTTVGMPIIPKGTSAILGLGAIEKRVVVVTDSESGEDSMAIRKRSFFSLAYDHRLVDGADAARFLARLKEVLEDFPEDA